MRKPQRPVLQKRFSVSESLTLVSPAKALKQFEIQSENGWVQDRTLTLGDIFFHAISTHSLPSFCYLTVSFSLFFCFFVCLFVFLEMIFPKNERNGIWLVLGLLLNSKWMDISVISIWISLIFLIFYEFYMT